MQMALGFSQVTAALSFPVDNLFGIAQWGASVEGVMALQDAISRLEVKIGENRIPVKHESSSFHSREVLVIKHDRMPLMQELTYRLPPAHSAHPRRTLLERP